MVVILFRYEWGIWHAGRYEGRYVLVAPPVPAALLMLSWNLVRRQCGDYEAMVRQWEALRAALGKVGYTLTRQREAVQTCAEQTWCPAATTSPE